MGPTLFAGAGAECDLGLSAGDNYTIDTFFTKKESLYRALKSFYQTRLPSAGDDARCPSAYAAQFLFTRDGIPFKRLLENIAQGHRAKLESLTGVIFDDRSVADLSSAELEKLFKELIVTNEESGRGQTIMPILASAVSDVHYGILETYFSSSLNPSGHSGQFWKLINFYWSAFFCIALPLLGPWLDDRGVKRSGWYRYSLKNLAGALSYIFSDEAIGKATHAKESSYCRVLEGCFENVLTTNYTPFSTLFARDGDNAIYLAGSLRTFENPETLEVFDALENLELLEQGAVFPFMMAQAPVKPIVSPYQMREYSKALRVLDETDTLCVLGYSFTQNDGHIISMIREYLLREKPARLIYFQHGDLDDYAADSDKTELACKLRLNYCKVVDKIEVVRTGRDENCAHRVKDCLEQRGVISACR